MDIRVIAGYPEGGINALVQYLAIEGLLEAAVVPSRAFNREAAQLALRFGAVNLAGRLSRSVPSEARVVEVAPWYEPVRMASRLVRSTGHAPLDSPLKHAFGRRASRVGGRPEVIVSLPGFALGSFSRQVSAVRVLHQVDGHPIARNDALRNFYGSAAKSEMVLGRGLMQLLRELDHSDLILSPSNVVTEGLLRNGTPAARVRQHYYGVSLSRFQGPMATTKANSAPRVLYVGQISYRKGIPFLIEAARKSKVALDLVGPVISRELLASLPSNVAYRGVAQHSVVAELMAKADAFVIASVEDACPLVVFEAGASGLPVIASDACGSAMALPPQDSKILPVGDVPALKQALDGVEVQRSGQREERANRFRAAVLSSSHLVDWGGWARWVHLVIREAVERQER